MNMDRAAATARMLETVENYSLAEVRRGETVQAHHPGDFYSDENFWEYALRGKVPFGTEVQFWDGAVSEWIPRVPGLFWTPAAAAQRKFDQKDIERYAVDGVVLRPLGKSRLVGGGIGTLRLPPSALGDRLVTIATSGNVSAGIPALVSDDVWTGAKLKEGAVIDFRARWEPMDVSWAERFPSTRGIPRGYLRLDAPGLLSNGAARMAATQIHPFSVMEYVSGNTRLFDFVFATAIPVDKNFRGEIATFFDQYKNAEGRNGRYLLAADVAEPMWDADFASPDQLKRDPNYELLLRRIEDSMSGKDTTEHLLRVLCNTDLDLLKRFGADIGIPHALWFKGGSLADESANLLERVTPDKIPLLLDSISAVDAKYLEV